MTTLLHHYILTIPFSYIIVIGPPVQGHLPKNLSADIFGADRDGEATGDDDRLLKSIQLLDGIYLTKKSFLNLESADTSTIENLYELFCLVDQSSKNTLTHLVLDSNQGSSNACVSIVHHFATFFSATKQGVCKIGNKPRFIQIAMKNSIDMAVTKGLHSAIANRNSLLTPSVAIVIMMANSLELSII